MRRTALAVVAASLVVAAVMALAPAPARADSPVPPLASLGIPLPVPIPGVGGPCDIPGIDRACNAIGGVIDKIPNPFAAAAGFVAGEAEKSFTHWLADSAAAVLGDVLRAADVTLQPDLGPQSFFAGRLRQVAALGGGIALLFLLLAIGQALLRGDPALIVTAVLVRLPVAFGATAALLFLTATVVAAVDQATAFVLGGDIEQGASQFMKNLSDAFSSDDFGGVSLALVALCALGTILIGILLYAELAVRAAVIYLALLFMPLGLAASAWRSAGRVARRLVDILVAAILAKFVILVTLWFAAGLLAQAASSGGAAGFGAFVIGFVVLFLAAASPLVLLGFVAHAEHAVSSIAQARHAAYAPPRRSAAIASRGARAAFAGGGGVAGPALLIADSRGSAATPRSRLGSGPAERATDAGRATAPPRPASSTAARTDAQSPAVSVVDGASTRDRGDRGGSA